MPLSIFLKDLSLALRKSSFPFSNSETFKIIKKSFIINRLGLVNVEEAPI